MENDMYKTKYDWQYVTKNDGIKHQGLKDGVVQWTRGKMLGGCSSINNMFYVRGQDQDFQTWYDEGNPSWTPENVNAYFRKAENFQDMKLNRKFDIHETYGHDGPLIINTFNSTDAELAERVLDSWEHLGMKRVPDINVAEFKGYGLCAISRANAANGSRQSTYKTYLKPALRRRNVKVLTNAFVTKILINDNAQAYGVEVDVNGKQKIFFANLEVIISTGTINTPQLLMLSGIGPEEHLLSKNIPCKVNLPYVGQNLQDHSYILIPIYTDEPGPEKSSERMFDVIKYLYNKTGYLAHSKVLNLGIFYSQHKDMNYPEFQSAAIVFRPNTTTAQTYLSTIKDNVKNSILRYNSKKALYMISFHVLHPFSRGVIYLNTSNPYDHPIIDANYYGDYRDLVSSVYGVKEISKLVNTPIFKSLNAFIPRIYLPQCNDYEFLSDTFWECYAIHLTQTLYHPVGTAKMGLDPRNSVVNNFLKVHGVKKLRVIDASIMPYETSGNTHAPVIMIGEMASDMIKAEYL
ncbi:ecdysone oxidase-like [Bicyclus anynana]|uniref:Ecdysone oxidase-like n=1 Tax=Bicyclus anynana TaxID=110368 RepID=A0ABM3LMJ8_BICAN|nr:ecdysone oxidase-like [Bicyclus anynana]